MKIPISKLSLGFHELDFEDSLESFGLSNEQVFSKPVTGHVKVDRGASHIYIQAAVKTQGQFSCDRCLREFDQEISGETRLYYEVVSTGERTGFNEDEAEVRTYRSGDAFIDITPDVRETLVLSLPMKMVCSPDCKGICPGCGEDLHESACHCGEKPVDPRWDALKQLLDKTPEGG